MERIGELVRNTNETKISVKLNLDGVGNYKIKTDSGFFNHMLELFSAHSGIDLFIDAKGDIEVDAHHLVEDVGIAIGKCINKALDDKKGIKRFGDISLPMDDVLCNVALDISGRPFIVFNAELYGNSGDFDMQLVEEFMRALAFNAGITLHISVVYGNNFHHKAESIFKGVARALKKAVKIKGDIIPSTKGII